MRNITLIGNIFGMDGYSNHVRQFANALYKQNKNINLVTQKPMGWEIGCPDNFFDMCSKKETYNDGVSIAVMFPHQCPLYWHDCKDFICYLVWEGDSIPEFWLDYLFDEHISQIWVPSTHVKDAILNTLPKRRGILLRTGEEIKDKIRIVPEGVDPELFKIEKESHKKFTFIVNKGWRNNINDRGGTQYALQAFNEEFKDSEPVEMIVKINPVYNGPDWNLHKELEKIGITKINKNVKFNTEILQYKQLYKLYNAGDCFLFPTMGEAFGLTAIEAMSCGLPIIYTDFGGQLDFVPEANWNIPYKLVPANDGPMYEDVKWAKPDIEQLRLDMREAFNDKIVCDKVGLINREFVVKNFTWVHAASKALKFIEEL